MLVLMIVMIPLLHTIAPPFTPRPEFRKVGPSSPCRASDDVTTPSNDVTAASMFVIFPPAPFASIGPDSVTSSDEDAIGSVALSHPPKGIPGDTSDGAASLLSSLTSSMSSRSGLYARE